MDVLAPAAEVGVRRVGRVAVGFSFPAIDILRGFAAVSVVVYHVVEHFGWTAFPVEGPLLWFRIGWMGVDLFLVISGFVISLSAAGLLERYAYGPFLREFGLRRFTRIAPLHYLTCLVFVVFVMPEWLVHPDLWKQLLAHFGFVHNLGYDYAGSINGPNWSIGLEVQFYLLCGLLAPVLWRCRWWHLAVVAVALGWGWRWWMLQVIPEGETFHRFVATTQLPGTLDEFAAGILLARLVRGRYGGFVLGYGRRYPWVPAAVAGVAVWAMLRVFWGQASYWDSAAMVVLWRTGCAAACALVLFAACCLEGRVFLVVSAPLRYLGRISFGIYLWHLPVLLSVKRIGWVPPGLALWIVLAGTLVLAAGSWHFFEKRLLRSGALGG